MHPNSKQKILVGILIAAAMIAPLVPASSAQVVNEGGVAAGGCNSGGGLYGGVGSHGNSAGTPDNTYHYTYGALAGVPTNSRDGCVDDAVTDADSWLFESGADDTIGVGETLLYARSGSVAAITDPTLKPYDCFGDPTYVGCTEP